ncbi:hypothetical protein B0H12DRAFT_1151756 [Mycena haematopus]|nr:hypothetical protein B0H12DRAFT_1151756 [Mycena haematopus]
MSSRDFAIEYRLTHHQVAIWVSSAPSREFRSSESAPQTPSPCVYTRSVSPPASSLPLRFLSILETRDALAHLKLRILIVSHFHVHVLAGCACVLSWILLNKTRARRGRKERKSVYQSYALPFKSTSAAPTRHRHPAYVRSSRSSTCRSRRHLE